MSLCFKLLSLKNTDVTRFFLWLLMSITIYYWLINFYPFSFIVYFDVFFFHWYGGRKKDSSLTEETFHLLKTSRRWVMKRKEMGFRFSQDWVQCLAFLLARRVTLGTLLISTSMFLDMKRRILIHPLGVVVYK